MFCSIDKMNSSLLFNDLAMLFHLFHVFEIRYDLEADGEIITRDEFRKKLSVLSKNIWNKWNKIYINTLKPNIHAGLRLFHPLSKTWNI